jgi:hypothetical protein
MPVDTSQRAATGTRCYGHLDPHDTFEAATERAQKRGMSRSEFFSLAVRRYLDELDRESITQQVDEALRAAGSDEAAAAVVAAGRRRLSTSVDW